MQTHNAPSSIKSAISSVTYTFFITFVPQNMKKKNWNEIEARHGYYKLASWCC